MTVVDLDITKRTPASLQLPPTDQPGPRGIPNGTLARLADEFRLDIVEMITRAGSGHPGGSFSAVNIITTLLFDEMRHRPREPRWADRDRLVLSKGHAVPALYAPLARLGYFPREELWTLRKLGSRLQGHPANMLCPGIEASTGSLGQGLSVAQGMALAAKLDGKDGTPRYRVYCILGDGESQEGQVWETAMSAPRHKVTNLTVFVDCNQGQIDGLVKDVMDLEPFVDKWKSFNWNVLTIDGHDFDQIKRALAAARAETGKPTVVIARTHKGVGARIFEKDIVGWHGKSPSRQEADEAIRDILGRLS
ncbi:MAG: transketolase [Myxococcota bacterium]